MANDNSLGLNIEFSNQQQFTGTLSTLEQVLNSIEKRLGTTVDLFSNLESRIRGFSGALSGASGAQTFLGTLTQIDKQLRGTSLDKTAAKLQAVVAPAKAASKALTDLARALDTGAVVVAGDNFATTLNSVYATLGAVDLTGLARRLTTAGTSLPAILASTKKLSKALTEFTSLNIDALPAALEKIFAALDIANSGNVAAETEQLQTSLNNLSVTMKFFFDRLKTISDGLDSKVADKITKVADALKNLRKLTFDKAVESIQTGARNLAEAVNQLNFVNFSRLETVGNEIKTFVNNLAEIKFTGFLRAANSLDRAFAQFNHFLEGLQSLPGKTLEVETTLRSFVESIKTIDLGGFTTAFKQAGLTEVAEKLRNFSSTVQASSTKLEALGVNFRAFQDNLKLVSATDTAGTIDTFTQLSGAISKINSDGNVKGTPPFVSVISQLSKALKTLGEIDAGGLEKLKSTFNTLREITIQASELSSSKTLGLSVFNRIASEVSARLVGGGADPFRILAQRVSALADVARGVQVLASFPKVDVTNIIPAIESILGVAERINQKAVFVGILPRIFLTFVSAFTKNIPLISKALDLSSLEDISQRVLVLQRLILSIQRVGSLPAVNLDQLRNTVAQLVGVIHEIERAFSGNVLTSIFERVSRGFINLTAGGNVFERTATTIKALTDSVSALKGLQKLDVGEIDSTLRTLSSALSKIGGFFRTVKQDNPQATQGFLTISTAIKGFGEAIEKSANLTVRFANAISLIRRELPKATNELARGIRSGGVEKAFGEEGQQMAQATLKGIRETWEIASPSRVMIRYANQLFDGMKVVVQTYPFAPLAAAAALGFVNPLIAGMVTGAALILPRLLTTFNQIATGLAAKMREIGGRLREEGKRLAQEGFQELTTGGIFAFLQKQQVSMAANFDATVNQIRIFGGLAGKALKDVENDLLRFSAVTIFNPQQSADAFLDLQKSGLQTAEALKSLTSTGDLATAGSIQLTEAVKGTTIAMKVFGLGAEDTNRIADTFVQVANKSTASVSDLIAGLGNVGAIAKQFGLSLEQTVGILGIFNDNGITGAEAGTQLKSVLAGITRPTAEVKKVFQQLNVSLTDAKGNFRNFNDILSDLSNAMASTKTVSVQVSGLTTDQVQRLELLKKAYANASKQIQIYNVAAETGATPAAKAAEAVKRYQGIQANAAKAIAELTKSQSTGARITTEITRSQAQNFAAIQQLAGSFGGSGLAVLLSQGDDALNQYIADFQKLPGAAKIADEQMKSFKGTFESFKGSVETLIIKAIRPLLNDVVAPLLQGLTELVNRLAELPEPILKFAAGVALLVSGFTTLSGATKILAGSFKTISGTLLQVGASAVQTSAAIAAPSAGSLVSSILAFAGGLAAAIPVLAAFGAALYVGYNAFIAIQRDFESNAGGLRDAVVGVFSAIRESVGSVLSIIRDGLSIVGTLLGDVGKQIQEAFSSQLIRDAARTAQNLFSGIAQTLDTIAKTIAFVKEGLQAISGIPAPPAAATPATVPAATTPGVGERKIKAGDTYTKIAKETGTTVEDLKKLNNNTALFADVTTLKVPMEIVPPAPAKLEATVKDLTVSAADAALIDEGKVNLGLARRIGVQLTSQIDPLEQLFRRISTTDFFKSIFGETDLTGALNTLKQFRAGIEGIGKTISDLVGAFSRGGAIGAITKLVSLIGNLIPTNFDIDLGGIRDVFVGLVEGFERILGIGSGVSNFFKNLLKGLGVLKVDLRPIAKNIGDFFDQIRKFDFGKFAGGVFTAIRDTFNRVVRFLRSAADAILKTIFDVFNGKVDLGSVIGNIFDGLVNFIKSIDFGQIADNARKFVSGLIDELKKAITNSPIGKAIVDAFASLSKIDLGKILSDLFGGGADKSGKKVNGLASIVNTAVADLTPGFSALKTFVDTYVTPVANAIGTGFSLIVNALTNNLTPEQSKSISDFVTNLGKTFNEIKTKLQPVFNGIDTVIVQPIKNFGEGISGFIKNLQQINGKDIEGALSLVLKIGGAVAGFVGSVAVGVIGGIIDGVSKALPRIGEGIAQFVKSLSSLDKGDLSSFLKEFANSLIQFASAILEIPVSIVDSVVKFFQELLGLKATGIRPALEEIGTSIAAFVRGAIRQFDNLQRSFRKTIVGFRLVGAIIGGDMKAQAELLAEDTAFAISDKFGKVFGDLNAGKINLTTALESLKVNINGTVVDLTKADPAQIAAALGIEQKEGLVGAVKQAIDFLDTKALKVLVPILAQPEFKGVEGVSEQIAALTKKALELLRAENDSSLLELTIPALINLDPKQLSDADKETLRIEIQKRFDDAIKNGDLAAIQMLLPIAPKFGVATDPAVLKKQISDAIVAALASGDSKNLSLALQLAPQFGIDPKTLATNFNDALASAFKTGDEKGLEALVNLAPQFGTSKEDIVKKYQEFLATAKDAALQAAKQQDSGGKEGNTPEPVIADPGILKLLGLDPDQAKAAADQFIAGLNIDKKAFAQSLIDLFTPKEGESYDAKLPLESINFKATDTEIDNFTKKLTDSGVPAKVALGIRNAIRDAVKKKQAAGETVDVSDPNTINIIDFVNFSGLKDDVAALPPETRQKLAAFGLGIANDVFAGLADADSSQLVTTSASWADTIVKTVKDTLGIKSPSTVFYDIGTASIEGLNNGLTDNLPMFQGLIYQLEALYYGLQTTVASVSDTIYFYITNMTVGAIPLFGAGIGIIYAYQNAWLELEVVLLRIQSVVRDIATVTGAFAAAFGVKVPAVPPQPNPPKRAGGGNVERGKMYEVNDDRYGSPELLRANGKTYIIPSESGMIVPPSPASIGGYGGGMASFTQNVNISINGTGLPAQQIATAIRSELASMQRQNSVGRKLALAGRK